MTRRFILLSVCLLALTSSFAFAGTPVPEVRVVKPVGDAIAGPHGQTLRDTLGPNGTILDAGACASESRYDFRPPERNYGAECRRLKVVFGPIVVKPGQDDVLIQPVTIEKPLYDGFITRFKPNLVDAVGATPAVEELHLHHGTWLNSSLLDDYGFPAEVGRSYGEGPWIASGEEKTIVIWPHRYGLQIGAEDTWLFLHMVHNATPEPLAVFVEYDLDYIAAEDAAVVQPDGKPLITNSRGVWLDAGGSDFHPRTETYTLNPIFNIQRGFGSGGVCRWPDANCAAFNSEGNVSAQQGEDYSPDVAGWEKTITANTLGGRQTGTLIMMGGHVHNGGLRTEVELVRDGVSKMINISDAYYWQDAPNNDRIGAAPVSWDYSQNGVTLDLGWAVNVKVGDKLRLNGVYDTAVGSWYEQMSIVMTWVVPGGISEGIDVFDPAVSVDPGIATTALVPNDADGAPLARTCVPSATRLCARGQITHPQIPSSGNHGNGVGSSVDWNAVPDGLHLNEIAIGGFSYGVTEQGLSRTAGVTYVNLGESISFHNLDTADYMWHTITRCAFPCTGPTTVDYPIADAGGALEWVPFNPVPTSGPLGRWIDPMDFDSTQLGIGTGPTQRVSWTYEPTKAGTYTFFCRVHPMMRGVFRVK